MIIMKSSLLWDIKLCGALKIIRPFEKNIASFFRVKKIKQARNQHEASRRRRRHVPPKRRLTLNRLHSVLPQKTGLFVTNYTYAP